MPVPALHPWLTELALVARNSARHRLHRWAESLLHGVGWAALGAIGLAALSRIDGDRFGLILRLLTEQTLVTVAMFAALGFAMTRAAVLALATQLREGWWGAMPVRTSATARTLLLAATVFAVCGGLIIVALLCLVALTAAHWYEWFARAVLIMPSGLLLGAIGGYFAARHAHADLRPRQRSVGSSAPLLPLPGMEHRQLRFFAEWQRRELLRSWRSGGRAAQLGALALLIPANQAFASLLGLLILGISLIWFGMALRASQDVIVRATALLAALPLRFDRFAAASLRYPAYAWLGAGLLGVVGLLLQGASATVCALYFVVLGSLAALSLVLCWRYRHRPWLARTRTPVEIALLGLLAQQIGVLTLPVAVALMLRHYHLARKYR